MASRTPDYRVPRSVQRVLDDLLNAEQVEEHFGWGPGSLYAISRRYDDWPPPVLESTGGRGRWWYRPHLDRWRDRHQPRDPAPHAPDDV